MSTGFLLAASGATTVLLAAAQDRLLLSSIAHAVSATEMKFCFIYFPERVKLNAMNSSFFGIKHVS